MNRVHSRARSLLVSCFVAAAMAAGCGDDQPAPTTPTEPASPVTTTLSSILTVNGAVSRLFTTTKAGTVTVTLSAAGAPGTIVGLGIGVPSSGVARCALSAAVNTAAGSQPQFSVPVDNGTYCVAVYDIGRLADTIPIELTIVYP
jgi:hypothetical protein